MPKARDVQLSCTFPISEYPVITMAHGGGGKFTAQLIDQIFKPVFEPEERLPEHDGATLSLGSSTIAFTTDSFVVSPLFFPGGDIGKLAVIGSCNDLAMCGAIPQYLSCGFILEEGLKTATLVEVVSSMQKAAQEAGVKLVTGDTKVVEKGKGDGIFVNTSGIGIVTHGLKINPSSIIPGDVIILSGDVGRHGVCILAKREGLEFSTEIESDCAHLSPAVQALLNANVQVHCLRDLTRGGLSTALVELAEGSGSLIRVRETDVPVTDAVRGVCETLGLDPFYSANEGRFVAIVPSNDADRALNILKSCPVSRDARVIGEVCSPSGAGARPQVRLTTAFGIERMIERLSGEQLPRIC